MMVQTGRPAHALNLNIRPAFRARSHDPLFKPAVAIVVLSLLLKVIGVAALLTAEGYDRVAGYEGTYGAAFFVAAYWGIVELIVAAPTLFAAVVLLRNLIAGNRRLSWLAIPALLLNAPVWILVLMTFS